MANEATIRVSLKIAKGNIDYQSGGGSTVFNADVATGLGPTPGLVTASNTGTVIDLSELLDPALCHVKNLDTVGYIEIGIYDPERYVYYPFMELLPGERYVFRLSRNFGEELGTGTGTTPATNLLHAKVFGGGTGYLLFEAFEA